MRTRLKGLGLVLSLLPVIPVDAEPVELAPGVDWLSGAFEPGRQPDGNTLIWRGDSGLVVFDTGRHPEHTRAILDFSRDRKTPIIAIINSHWHLDHSGGDGLLRRAYPKAELIASDAVFAARDGFLGQYEKTLKAMLADAKTSAEQRPALVAELALLAKPDDLLPTHVVNADESFRRDGQVLEIHRENGAVTAGDLWVLDPKSGVLAAGDLVTLPAPLFDTACPERWRESLKHLAQARFTTLVPGHGMPMDRQHFLAYQRAFAHLLHCASGAEKAQTCIDGWIADTRIFQPSTDSKLTRSLLGYYLDNILRGPNAGHYCLATKMKTPA